MFSKPANKFSKTPPPPKGQAHQNLSPPGEFQ